MTGDVCICGWSGAPTGHWPFGLCPHEPDDRILYYIPRQEVIGWLTLHDPIESSRMGKFSNMALAPIGWFIVAGIFKVRL